MRFVNRVAANFFFSALPDLCGFLKRLSILPEGRSALNIFESSLTTTTLYSDYRSVLLYLPIVNY